MLEKTNIFANQQIFRNATFDFLINEDGGEIDGNIEFFDCIFNSAVSIENLKVKGKFRFSGCTFNHYCILKNVECTILFNLNGGHINDCFNIHSCKSPNLDLSFLNGNKSFINGDFESINISHNTLNEIILKDINTHHSYLNSVVEIRNNNIKKIEIKSSNLCSSLKFVTGNYDTIILEGGFKENLIFEEDIKIDYLFFESSTFEKRIDIKDGNYKYINLYRSLFKGLFMIQDYDILENSTNSLQIENLSIHANHFEKDITVSFSKNIRYSISDNNFPYSLYIKGYKTESDIGVDFNMSGINYGNVVVENIKGNIDLRCINFGTISFNEIDTNYITLVEFQNYGKLSFFNVSPSRKKVGYIVIQDSKLGETEFLNTDFEKFGEIVIANSNISNIILHKYFFNVVSYNKNKMIGYGIKNKKENFSNLKNVYNQLKKSALNKGEIDSASKYQSLEYLNLSKSRKFGADKLLLFLNHISNKNGYSWGRGIFFTLIISILSFCIYTLLNEKENYLYSQQYLDNTLQELKKLDLWNKFIKFFTSFPKLTLDEYKKDSWEINLWVWLARVFIGYGIYQTIAAFRKYGKS